MTPPIHQLMSTVKVPAPQDLVYKDECMFSFDTPESPTGLFTSLTSWQSFGLDHVRDDFARNGNPLYLKQLWKRVAIPQNHANTTNPNTSAPPSKLAIGVEGGFDLDATTYERQIVNSIVILPSFEQIPFPSDQLPTIVTMSVDAILKHVGFVRSSQIASAWEEEDRKVSRYADGLPQLDNGKKVSPDPSKWRCEESGMSENLWLNLSTGYIGSGRKAWDGSGGTGAALTHYEQTGKKYPLAVKLGTITPQGADVYSYAPDEDDMVLDPHLADHLAHWGINMQQQKKTEKTMTELQIDLNASYQFDKITESGSHLVPLHGPGYIGMENLGNSCYMASIMQILFSMPQLQSRYKEGSQAIFDSAPRDPAEDGLSMMAKLAVGLLSEKYAKPIPVYEKSDESPHGLRIATVKLNDDYGAVRPFMFKNWVGKGHQEFSGGQQQDASEFFQYFLEKIARVERTGTARLGHSEHANGEFVPTHALFGFKVEDRIEDMQSGKAIYTSRTENMLSLSIDVEAAVNKVQFKEFEEQTKKKMKVEGEDKAETIPVQLQVPFAACLKKYFDPEVVQGFKSPDTGEVGSAVKRTRMETFPEYLTVHLRRYYLAEDWTPRKLDASVPVPDELDLSMFRATGPSDGEHLFSNDDLSAQPSAAPPAIVPDPGIVSQLMAMGFSENGSKRAAIATNNASAEASMEWVFAHMEDPGFNDPPEADTTSTSNTPSGDDQVFTADVISSLTAMGFTDVQARASLKATGGSVERAADWLFSRADNLDAAVAEIEREDVANSATSGGDASSGISHLDGEPKYDLLGFASHLGSNTACGHYVAHIKKEGRFVLFNDSKVAISQNPPTDLGFVYVYQRRHG